MSKTKSQLSAAQLAARRANALLSTGPRTPEGKAIASMNAVTHGLCTTVAVLPGESVEEFQATLEGWVHELKPADSYERELVYNMVCASIALTRVRKADNAAASARVRDAGARWDDQRAQSLTALIESIYADRIEAHEALLRRGDGCRWLIARWNELAAALDDGGHWSFPLRELAIRLLGLHPGATSDPTVQLVHGLGRALEAERGINETEHALSQQSFGLDVVHNSNLREELRAIVADELEALESLRPALEAADAADREAAIATSYVDTTDDGMRRHRYLQDHLRTLRQLSASLIASKKARHTPRPVAFAAPAPVARPTPMPAEAPARNEAKNDATHYSEMVSDANPVPAPTRLVSKLFAAWAPRPAAALAGVV
ncbi:MAG TPA: hypothetical protein VG406_06050 [Isosphaeraceae bacterium]|jgi:hypothetical protein|nr:hypothetical protein [Isosphaeraceae bacterium]